MVSLRLLNSKQDITTLRHANLSATSADIIEFIFCVRSIEKKCFRINIEDISSYSVSVNGIPLVFRLTIVNTVY